MKHLIAFSCGPIEVDDAEEHTHLGVRFVVHSVPGWSRWFRASEWGSGYGIPNTMTLDREQAKAYAILEIDKAGPEKVKRALAKLPVLNSPACTPECGTSQCDECPLTPADNP